MRSLTLVAILAGTACGWADEPKESSPRAKRWESLPAGVEHVRVDARGRTWTFLAGRQPPLDDLEKIVEREYERETPELKGVEPALFEPGGRAWFHVRGARSLIGWDGESWVRHQIPWYHGTCPTRGEPATNRSNLAAGGRAFFPDHRGVHVFDGREWSYREIVTDELKEEHGSNYGFGAWHAVSPDGKWVVARCRHSADWHVFEGGTWRIERLGDPALSRAALTFSVSNDGTLRFLHGRGRLAQVRLLDGEERNPERLRARVEKLVDDLVGGDEERRNEATRELVKIGSYARPQLRELVKTSEDESLRTALKEILGRAHPVDEETRHLAGLELHEFHSPQHDQLGRLWIPCVRMMPVGTPREAILLAVDPDGTERVAIRGRDAIPWLRSGLQRIFSPDGDRVWVSRSNQRLPIALYEFAEEGYVAELDEAGSWRLEAVDGAGRVIVESSSSGRMMWYTPGLLDERPRLRATPFPIERGRVLAASDGSIWANREAGLSRFDGTAWKVLLEVTGDANGPMAAGAGGVVLVGRPADCRLFRGDQQLASGSIRDVITSQRDGIKKAFGPGAHPGIASPAGYFSIVADRDGNVWYTDARRLNVLVDDDWIDAGTILRRAGARSEATSEFVALVGDGRRVHVATESGAAFFGKVFDWNPRFERVALPDLDWKSLRGLRDPEGGLWVEDVRVDDEGVQRDLGAKPALLDRAGNVWLRRERSGELRVWRDGEIVQTLSLPNAHEVRGLVSDAPGSVYAWTSAGLMHLVADAPRHDEFRVRETYVLDPVPVARMVAGKGGFAVVDTTHYPSNLKLHWFEFPNREKEVSEASDAADGD